MDGSTSVLSVVRQGSAGFWLSLILITHWNKDVEEQKRLESKETEWVC